jgi:hypothetical protein
VLYGFIFGKLTPLPFRPYPGWVRFFSVEAERTRRSKRGTGTATLWDANDQR